MYDNIEGYLKEANKSYQRQRDEIPAPVMPADPTGLPDLTEEIDGWLFEKEKEFQEMLNIYNDGVQGIWQYMSVYLTTAIEFYNQIKTGGEMDIKEVEAWDKAFVVEYPSFFTYRGEIMDPGTLGNITYGYIGASLFPDIMLYMGGAMLT